MALPSPARDCSWRFSWIGDPMIGYMDEDGAWRVGGVPGEVHGSSSIGRRQNDPAHVANLAILVVVLHRHDGAGDHVVILLC
ncbi:hypothetical protein M5K25_007944 [Dendrobium thyrsiflorum]|uniref:Uncharacterized protein n=1 Tax=Dendrobium thyrsiflorum TaxID=117978 RepID=A0ABD0V7G7_DENTH